MTPEECTLIQRDHDLPGLALILNEHKMQRVLQTLLDGSVRSVSKQYTRYKKGTNCLTQYRFVWKGVSQTLYAKAYRPLDTDKLQKRADRLSQHGLKRFTLPEHFVLVALFPHDEKLSVLTRLSDPLLCSQLLKRVLYHPDEYADAKFTVIQYKPERRLVGLIESPSGKKAVLKLYSKARYQKAKPAHRQKLEGKKMLNLVGRSHKHRILVYDWKPGEALSQLWAEPDFDLALIEKTGHKLAQFHIEPRAGQLEEQAVSLHCESLRQLAKGVNQLLPDISEQVTILVEALVKALTALTSPKSRAHGDFYAKQVLISEGRVSILDLDDLCLWYPAADIGLFIAHLEREQIRENLTQIQVAERRESFLMGYQQVSAYEPYEVELFTAVGLLQLIHHPFRNNEANWPERTDALFRFCQAHYDRYLKYLTHRLTVEHTDSSMPFLSELMQMETIAPLIQQAIPKAWLTSKNAQLLSITPVRHKVGKRILLEYHFGLGRNRKTEASQTVIGKARAKSFDKRTWLLNQHLFRQGFNSDSQHQVPKPLGSLPSHHIWFQEKVVGERLFPLLCSPRGKEVGEEVAIALSKLHHCDVPLHRHHHLEDELSILAHSLALAAEQRPEQSERIETLHTHCHRIAKKLPPVVPRVIHRDFYHDQVLIDGKTVYLLDLDLASVGDPYIDVGNFVAHVQEQCLRLYGDMHYASHSIEAFLNKYQSLNPGDVSQAIEIYRLLSMVRHIYISQRIKERNAFTQSILEYCETSIALNF